MLSRYLLCMSRTGANTVKLGKNCFPENYENFLNMLIKGRKHLKCGNLHNNNASVSEPHENL